MILCDVCVDVCVCVLTMCDACECCEFHFYDC